MRKYFLIVYVLLSEYNIVFGQNHGFTLSKSKPDFNLITSNNSSGVKHIASPATAVSQAVADLSSLQKIDQPFQRYIWIPDGSPEKAAQVSFAVNTAISKASIIIKPTVVADGQLLRWDLRALAPRDGQYTTLHALWEKLAFEPYFHITKTTNDALPTNAVAIDKLADDPPGSSRFKIDNKTWFRSSSGDWFVLSDDNTWITQNPIGVSKQNVATYGAHCGLQQSVLFQGLSQSNAAIVRYDWFFTKVLTTLDGGLYYEFAGIERNPKGKTAQAALLESLGVSEEQIEKLRSDQRSAIFRSNVTGRPRRIDVFQGSGVRPSSGSGLITLTYDVGEGDIDPATDPIRNLLNAEDKARELIAERPNGMHIFALFDGNGGLQNQAPDNVARDHTIPSPHSARLQPAISCIRCHGPHDGYQPFDNDVQKGMKGLLNIFDDLSSKKAIPDTLERLAGLYSGDLLKPIRRGRDDYSDAVYIATNGLTIPKVSDGLSESYGAYQYNTIDAYQACLELGYQVPKDKAVYYLNLIIPPLQKDIVGISPEDPILGALKAGLAVNRFQWEQVYADAAFRAMQSQIVRENIKSK